MFHDLVQLNYATVIIIGFMLIFICTNQFFHKNITNLFVLASLCILTLVIVDSVEYRLAALPYPTTARIWMSSIGYSLRPAIIYTIILLVTREEATRQLVMAVPLVLNMCVSFSALFTDIAFSYAGDNSFVRGPLGYAAFVTSGFYLVLLLVSTIRRYQNEGTLVRRKLTNPYVSKVAYRKGTQGTETSKYLQEKKEKSIPRVVASEIGGA